MVGTEGETYRDTAPYWREDESLQNFGDYLTAYLLERLFVRVPRLPGDVRIIGSYLDDYHAGMAANLTVACGLPQRAKLIAWAGGVRTPGGLSEARRDQVQILSVRGPLSARDLELGDDFPTGDPGLLMPALYSPGRDTEFQGRTLCVPHFDDTRSDADIRLACGADLVLRPAIGKSFEDIETFIDRLVSADFVLCGSLHAAIVLAAYGRPFAFWDSGNVDIPFKWEDFALSVGIPCVFCSDITAGRRFFDEQIKPVLHIPPLWDALAVAPYPIRSEALLRILMGTSPAGATEPLAEILSVFSRHRSSTDEIVEDAAVLVETLQRVASKAAATERELEEARQAIGVLSAEGKQRAEELRRTYARPWRPLKRAIQRRVLRLLLILEGRTLSDRAAKRIRRSLDKRRPARYIAEWEAVTARMRGVVDRDWDRAPESTYSEATISRREVMMFRGLRILSVLAQPIWPRQADRFRRSANKRDPFRWKPDLQVSSPRGPVRDPLRARRILVADWRLPRPDVSAGDQATFGLISDLRALGYEVVFLPTDMVDTSPYRAALENLGVEVVKQSRRHRHAADYISVEGGKFGAFYFIRVDVAEALLSTVRRMAPDARTIFHAPDLCFLRESRAAELSGVPRELEAAAKTKKREAAIMQAVDHVVLVSPAEIPFLEGIVPQSRISVFPALYSSVVAIPVDYAKRAHLFFLGGFKHGPNVDAVKWFVDKVWPAIHAALPGVEFHIVGAEAPEDVVNLGQTPGVRFVGYVADLDSALASYRLSVAPLRYGAGIKGKLGAAMGAGIPSVSTTIGAEGMGIVDGVHALVRDDAEAFAEATVALYQDGELWNRIAYNGKVLVEDSFGDKANQSAFLRVLDAAQALPLDLYVAHCRAAQPQALPNPGPAQDVDVSIIIPVHDQWASTCVCLNSVLRAVRGTGVSCEIILADDASVDETRHAAELFPGLRVVRQDENVGFLRNCNAAAITARGRYLLFLNNDTVVLPGWLAELARVMDEDPDVAIAGSKLLYPDQTIQEAGGILFSDASAINLGRGKPRDHLHHCFDREVDYAIGASIMVRRSFWDDVGGFDQQYVPAYCADSDLAMAARDRGMRVMYVAGAEVVHFEHGSYGQEVATSPKMLMATNRQKLLEKWRLSFANDHLPRSAAPEIATAHAERTLPTAVRARRQSGHLNILYFSPFPSHPDNHGNQATIQSFGYRYKQMGHKVHFALLQSDMFDEASAAAMRAAWDSFSVLPNARPLWSDGKAIPFDGWYESGLGENIRVLCAKYDIDVVFCSYVFQSKLLEFVPAHVLKVVDTHDKMGDRYEMLRRNGQPLEFFSCSPEEEGAYLSRADVVVARRAEEAEYFNSVSGRDTAIVIPHVEEPRFQERRFMEMRNVGMVASANRINLAITLEFLKTIQRHAAGGAVPFMVDIAGQVKNMIPDLRREDAAFFSLPWVRLHGFVPDIGSFYDAVDAVVSPVTMGTGINVKTVQAMAFGMPLVTTAWGSKGIETGHPMHQHKDLDALVDSLFWLADEPDQLEGLAEVSRDRYRSFFDASMQSMRSLFARVRC